MSVMDSSIELPTGYRPSESEPFMNERQKEYFRRKLLAWKDEILRESRSTLSNLQEDIGALPDLADRASTETDRALELRARDRQRKLISKIEAAIRRIEEDEYGYCERRASRFLWRVWMHARWRRSAWKPRNAMSGPSVCTGTTRGACVRSSRPDATSFHCL
jgi:DnaK suppressor protein